MDTAFLVIDYNQAVHQFCRGDETQRVRDARTMPACLDLFHHATACAELWGG